MLDRIVRKACSLTARVLGEPRIIRHGGKPYLSRWTIFDMRSRGGPECYLHFFHAGDAYGELHSHPWYGAVSLMLAGGYSEERRRGNDVERRDVRPGALTFLVAETTHRVDLLDPARGAWTLFLCAPRTPTGAWGFFDRRLWAYTPWEECKEARRQAAGLEVDPIPWDAPADPIDLKTFLERVGAELAPIDRLLDILDAAQKLAGFRSEPANDLTPAP